MPELQHPMVDHVETQGLLIALDDLIDGISARIREEPDNPHWLCGSRDDDDEEYCGKCIGAAYDKAIEALTPDEAEELTICTDSGDSNGPASCETCGDTIDYHYERHGCLQELEHFRTNGVNATFDDSNGMSIMRMMEYAQNLKVDDLAMLREIHDLGVVQFGLPDETKDREDTRKAA